jgi:hypothetical protein
MEQSHPQREELQFSENTGIDNNNIEDVSSAPFPTKKDEVPLLISDGSIDLSCLQDMGIWPT